MSCDAPASSARRLAPLAISALLHGGAQAGECPVRIKPEQDRPRGAVLMLERTEQVIGQQPRNAHHLLITLAGRRPDSWKGRMLTLTPSSMSGA